MGSFIHCSLRNGGDGAVCLGPPLNGVPRSPEQIYFRNGAPPNYVAPGPLNSLSGPELVEGLRLQARLVCLSLKDALTSGVGGLNLSVEDLQNVAAQLLTQQSTEKIASSEETGSHVPLDKQQQCNKQAAINGSSDTPVPRKGAEDLGKYCRKKSGNRPRSAPGDSQTDVPGGTAVPFQELGSAKNSAPSNQSKRRGGWPKGRKRKPELVDMRPPKAPATGYVLYLNEKRKNYKDLPFPEVTKLLGNEWSKLSLEDKRVYLVQAEVEKKRYREELKAYRQSDVYQSYLDRKRNKHLQENGTEESDMDATDEIEDEDNEELYCRICDQWFSSLHNKKEHLYGRQHLLVNITTNITRTGPIRCRHLAKDVDKCRATRVPPPSPWFHRQKYFLTRTSLDDSTFSRDAGENPRERRQELWLLAAIEMEHKHVSNKCGYSQYLCPTRRIRTFIFTCEQSSCLGQQLQVSISGEFTKERLAAAEQEGGSSGYSLSTTSLDESSLDGFTPPGVPGGKTRRQETGACPAPDMTDSICRLMTTYSEREREIRSLSSRLEQVRTKNAELMSALGELLAREGRLNAQLETETQLEVTLEQQLLSLWVLPTACLSSANTS
uniref:HMG box domain-containing protein n=1 Tax=Timema genevievae TaxID=629358 RepID=A0A7R9PPC6_TIMGE|nr:unnamed protein product [Timema genevievae]